jgi:hypothetical protein
MSFFTMNRKKERDFVYKLIHASVGTPYNSDGAISLHPTEQCRKCFLKIVRVKTFQIEIKNFYLIQSKSFETRTPLTLK